MSAHAVDCWEKEHQAEVVGCHGPTLMNDAAQRERSIDHGARGHLPLDVQALQHTSTMPARPWHEGESDGHKARQQAIGARETQRPQANGDK